MGENDLQNQIVQVLATVLGAQKQEELEQALQMMDEEGRNQLIQFVASAVQQGQVDDNTLAQAQQLAKQALQKGKARKAEFGAKLEYIKKLQGGGTPRRAKPTVNNVEKKKRVDPFGNEQDIVTINGSIGRVPTNVTRVITKYPIPPSFPGQPITENNDTTYYINHGSNYPEYSTHDSRTYDMLYGEDPAVVIMHPSDDTRREDKIRNARTELKRKAKVNAEQRKATKDKLNTALGTALVGLNPILGVGTLLGKKLFGFKKGGTLIPKRQSGNKRFL